MVVSFASRFFECDFHFNPMGKFTTVGLLYSRANDVKSLKSITIIAKIIQTSFGREIASKIYNRTAEPHL